MRRLKNVPFCDWFRLDEIPLIPTAQHCSHPQQSNTPLLSLPLLFLRSYSLTGIKVILNYSVYLWWDACMSRLLSTKVLNKWGITLRLCVAFVNKRVWYCRWHALLFLFFTDLGLSTTVGFKTILQAEFIAWQRDGWSRYRDIESKSK